MAGWPAHRAGRPRQSLKHPGLLVGRVEPRAERPAHPGGGPNAAIQLKGQMDGHVAALLAMTNKAPAAAVILGSEVGRPLRGRQIGSHSVTR